MMVFFSSWELVDFHYHLFLRTLPSRLGAPASGASTPLKFLRLHGNMEQEVSTARARERRREPTRGPGAGACPSGSAPPSLWDLTGPGGDAPQVGEPLALETAPTAVRAGQGRPLFPCARAPGAALFHLRELTGLSWPESASTSC